MWRGILARYSGKVFWQGILARYSVWQGILCGEVLCVARYSSEVFWQGIRSSFLQQNFANTLLVDLCRGCLAAVGNPVYISTIV
jgi:hypothetical protein